jgi:hypothetical protein
MTADTCDPPLLTAPPDSCLVGAHVQRIKGTEGRPLPLHAKLTLPLLVARFLIYPSSWIRAGRFYFAVSPATPGSLGLSSWAPLLGARPYEGCSYSALPLHE